MKINSIESSSNGTKIRGILSYAGYSKNGKLYPPSEIAKGDGLTIPIVLNHGSMTGGAQQIPDELLPKQYRRQLQDEKYILLGEANLTFDYENATLYYDGTVTDPFFSQKSILQNMSVSHGTIHDIPQERMCDAMRCFSIIRGLEFQEMSLVWNPGFPLVTLSAENTSFKDSIKQYTMTENTSNENQLDDKGTSKQPDADGQPENGKIFDNTKDGLTDVPKQKPVESGVSELEKATENAEEIIKKSKDKSEDKKEKSDEINNDDKKDDDDNTPKTDAPNVDQKDQKKSQENYVKQLIADERKRSQEALEATAKIAKAMMQVAKENSNGKALVSPQQFTDGSKTIGIEAVELDAKNWMQKVISGENTNNTLAWKISNENISKYLNRFFRKIDERGHENYIPYNQHMKEFGTEATNLNMIGGTTDNFLRTMSQLVLIDPEGAIVTPIEQFCEVITLNHGQKEAMFFDVNRGRFSPTDESGKNAGGSGYALKPSDIKINTSGGKITPEGTLVRLGYSDMEEIPIDLPQKINAGFALEAEHSKNHEALVTAYNDDTAYNDSTDKRRPKGGGAKHTADSIGNTHWINANTGTQITKANGDADKDITGKLTFKGILEARSILEQTGITQNPILYTTPSAIKDLILDDTIKTYIQRSRPEIITQAEIEKIAGVTLVKTDTLAPGATPKIKNVKRSVMFIPQIAFGMIKGRELMVKAEDVARDQSIYISASQKVGTFVKNAKFTVRLSHR